MLTLLIGMSVTVSAGAEDRPRVRMETSHGDMVIELFAERAPKTVENFLEYVDAGFYEGTIFHRVIPGFVIQGGGYTTEYERKDTNEPVKNESDNGLENKRGTLSMARTGDPHSATTQFFVNLADNPNLDHRGSGQWGYAVFAEVVEGMDVVDKIAEVPTGKAGPFGKDAPQQTVVIESVSRVESETEE